MSRIIINTRALYAEIPSNYDVLNVNLVAVKNVDIHRLREEKNREHTKSSQNSYYSGDEMTEEMGIDFPHGRDGETEEAFKVMYEVELLWEKWEQISGGQHGSYHTSDARRSGRLRTHAMTLDEALIEKKSMTKQIISRHEMVNAFREFLGDPSAAAVGMLSDKDWEREIAKIVSDAEEDQEEDA